MRNTQCHIKIPKGSAILFTRILLKLQKHVLSLSLVSLIFTVFHFNVRQKTNLVILILTGSSINKTNFNTRIYKKNVHLIFNHIKITRNSLYLKLCVKDKCGFDSSRFRDGEEEERGNKCRCSAWATKVLAKFISYIKSIARGKGCKNSYHTPSNPYAPRFHQ